MVNEMKTLLTQQTSIIISTTISQEFGKSDDFGEAAYREHVVNYSETGCHTMLVVGYSDFNNAFKVVNSWGTDWGNNGFVWIDYKAFDNVTDSTANFKVINEAYIAYDVLD
jgi:C1A family cysteine protease